jgi:predicted nucleic acid-binding protein
MLKIYLDTCSIQRPLDTQIQTRIRLETEAILGILAHIEEHTVLLISSTVLELEIANNPLPIRREQGEQVLSQATAIVLIDDTIEQRGLFFAQSGLKIMDALHLAAAEFAMVDYFCTCDERFLRRAREIRSLGTRVVSPLELIEVIEQ